jgi:6-pyruvoyltetrahydropterin/6-carboxytetrahydropterin synthase
MCRYRVRVSKDDLVFSAAHFITLEDATCEPLHGHDFRVTAEVAGPLDENQWVVDFVALHRALRTIVGELDHAVLLPAEHPRIGIHPSGDEIEVRWAERRWVFPRSECRILPVANTTAELLAGHVARRLWEYLRPLAAGRLDTVRIELVESPGQTAVCEMPHG